jgi:hypothetical protein
MPNTPVGALVELLVQSQDTAGQAHSHSLLCDRPTVQPALRRSRARAAAGGLPPDECYQRGDALPDARLQWRPSARPPRQSSSEETRRDALPLFGPAGQGGGFVASASSSVSEILAGAKWSMSARGRRRLVPARLFIAAVDPGSG